MGEDQQNDATGFFSVIKRRSETTLDSSVSSGKYTVDHLRASTDHDLYAVPYSEEYKSLLEKVATLLRKAGELTSSAR